MDESILTLFEMTALGRDQYAPMGISLFAPIHPDIGFHATARVVSLLRCVAGIHLRRESSLRPRLSPLSAGLIHQTAPNLTAPHSQQAEMLSFLVRLLDLCSSLSPGWCHLDFPKVR